MDESAAPAPAAPAAAADPMDAAVARVQARKEAAPADPKATGAAAGATTPGTSASDAAKPARPRAADLGALAQREWRAKEAEARAAAAVGKYAPLDQALEKKDLVGAMTTLAEKHGFTFADFVAAMSADKPTEKSPAEVAAATVATELAKRDAETAKAQAAAQKAAHEAQEAAFRTSLQEQAEKGAENAPDRWELIAIAGKAGEAWDVIWGHYVATTVRDAQGNVVQDGERMTREQALDLLEDKLKQKRDARRPKQDAANPSAGVNGRNEAAGNGNSGRAAAPQFTNRATSGIPAVVGAQAIDELGLPDNEAIDRIAARTGIRL
jgi:hypothetical protein